MAIKEITRDFTIINKNSNLNSCDNLPDLCQTPSVLADKVKCTPNYETNPIKIDTTPTCSEFCDSKYLINI